MPWFRGVGMFELVVCLADAGHVWVCGKLRAPGSESTTVGIHENRENPLRHAVSQSPASRSTAARWSACRYGALPAIALSRAWCRLLVAGMTTCTRLSDNTHLSNASDHERTPSLSISDESGWRRSAPSAKGRMTMTPRPSSSASGRILCSTTRSHGLYGIWIASIRPVFITTSSSSNAPESRWVAPMSPIRPRSRSFSRNERCALQATRLCTCSRSIQPPNSSTCRANWRCPSVSDRAHILVATMLSTRRSASALDKTASERPYIGEVSKRRVPAPSASATTPEAVASRDAGRSNVDHVPRPTTGRFRPVEPKARVSTASDSGRSR